MKPNFSFTVLLLLVMIGAPSIGQDAEYPAGQGIDLFSSEEPLQVKLCFDIREFMKTKYQSEYQNARLTVKLTEGDSVSQDIQLKARGFMRLSYCSFPPIMLKFKNDSGAEPIQKKGTLKLVTHCAKSALFEDYLFKEYLTYRFFNLVTPYSLRTRLVRITYVDVNKPGNAYTAYGFLIENEEQLAERNKAVVIRMTNITQKQMNPSDMARVAVFNYMIGNTDWSVPLQHNVKVLKSMTELTDKAIPVAYDFDYSALVNTVYSVPAEQLPIKNVAERYYQGICHDESVIRPVLEEFRGLQGQITGLINEFEYLSMSDKKQMETYIDGFFKMYRNENILISDINRTCKQF